MSIQKPPALEFTIGGKTFPLEVRGPPCSHSRHTDSLSHTATHGHMCKSTDSSRVDVLLLLVLAEVLLPRWTDGGLGPVHAVHHSAQAPGLGPGRQLHAQLLHRYRHAIRPHEEKRLP